MRKTKKNRVLVVLLAMLAFGAISNAVANNKPSNLEEYEPGQLVIKFKQNSIAGINWINNKKNSQIDFISEIIGKHTSRAYINVSLLNTLNKKSIPKKRLNSLERICLIEFEANIDPLYLAGKLRNIPEIEYAEAVPVNKTLSQPNDTLYSFQYYLEQVRAPEAWDQIESVDSIIVGIVDTGINYNHEDLKSSIYSNPGETGFDGNNRDKATNGIDDDNNGYVDDWRGWDFVSSQTSGQDNDPFPGHKHGTHIAGTIGAMTNNKIGIAGTYPKVKLMPVKVGKDEYNSTSVHNGYQGLLYAATMGAEVINCSWGSNNLSNSDKEILQTINEMGVVVVAAAGNNGDLEKFYPAGHITTISVTSVTSFERKSSFSNYHPSVDISAPGSGIVATVFEAGYQEMNGTSMAAPIVAAVAAMLKAKHPEYTPLQIKEIIKASAKNIDATTEEYIGLMGRGQVDAFEAVRDTKRKSVLLENFGYVNDKGEKLINPDQEITLSMSLINVLSELKGAYIKTVNNDEFSPIYQSDSIYIGDLASMERFYINDKLKFSVSNEIPDDYTLLLEFDLYDEEGIVNRIGELVYVKPSYRTMSSNNFTITLTSRGNYGYNNYPSNSQGDGIRYKGNYNYLYEGGLIIAHSKYNISNNVRGITQSRQDKDFVSLDIFNTTTDGIYATEEGFGFFTDHGYKEDAGVKVLQDVYQFDDEEKEDIVFIKYRVINTTSQPHDSLYIAKFMDFDLSGGGKNDKVKFDRENGVGYIFKYGDDTTPYIGSGMISDHELIFYAIDNNGESLNSPNLWNGFDDEEKWSVISSGVGRESSGIVDCSYVIGAGPISSIPGDTTTVVFAIYGGSDILDLISKDNIARNSLPLIGEDITKYIPKPNQDSLRKVYPNPTSGIINIEFSVVNSESRLSFLIIDELGRTVDVIIEDKKYVKNNYMIQYELRGLSVGRYYLQMKSDKVNQMIPLELAGY